MTPMETEAGKLFRRQAAKNAILMVISAIGVCVFATLGTFNGSIWCLIAVPLWLILTVYYAIVGTFDYIDAQDPARAVAIWRRTKQGEGKA